MPRFHKNTDGLIQAINEKARELQNLAESVDNAKREIVQFVERKQKLTKDAEELELLIKEKQKHLDSVVERERIFLSMTEKEAARNGALLIQQRAEIDRLATELANLEVRVCENQESIAKAEAERIEYMDWKRRTEKEAQSFNEAHARAVKEKEEIETGKRELGEYKNYLTDFYGKVAGYTETAKATLEYVNAALEGKFPRLRPPKEPITMENFNKL